MFGFRNFHLRIFLLKFLFFAICCHHLVQCKYEGKRVSMLLFKMLFGIHSNLNFELSSRFFSEQKIIVIFVQLSCSTKAILSVAVNRSTILAPNK